MQGQTSRRQGGWSWAKKEGINAKSWPTAPTCPSFVLSAGQQVRVTFNLVSSFWSACTPQGCTCWLSGLAISDLVFWNLSLSFSFFPFYVFFLPFPILAFLCFSSLISSPLLVFNITHFTSSLSDTPAFSYFSFIWVLSVYFSLNLSFFPFCLFYSVSLDLTVYLSLSSSLLSLRKMSWYFFQQFSILFSL